MKSGRFLLQCSPTRATLRYESGRSAPVLKARPSGATWELKRIIGNDGLLYQIRTLRMDSRVQSTKDRQYWKACRREPRIPLDHSHPLSEVSPSGRPSAPKPAA